MAKNCTVCQKQVIWEDIIEVFEDIFEQVDMRGEASLMESQQYVYLGEICSRDCYGELD